MFRALSFSKSGIALDADLHSSLKPKDQQSLIKVLRSKSCMNAKTKKPKSQVIGRKNDFRKTIDRQTLSSFQKCHTKIHNANAIYADKIELTKKNNPHFSMKRFNPPSYFETASNFYKTMHNESNSKYCEKFLTKLKSQKLLRTQSMSLIDFQKEKNTNKRIDFEKQTQRQFQIKLRRLQAQFSCVARPTSQKDDEKALLEKQKKLKKVHAFQSYLQHDLLNPEKVGKFSSALNTHKVDLRNTKQKNHNSHVKFDKFVEQIKTRHDRDCLPWVTKLGYDPKDQILRGSKTVRTFQKQMDRKINEVHSKYPMRLAM